MARKRRETTTADQIKVGDVIQTPQGLRGEVDSLGTSRCCTEPNVAVHWIYADDTSVSKAWRGMASGRIYRPDDEVTRWV
jgi:hypothetical protein